MLSWRKVEEEKVSKFVIFQHNTTPSSSTLYKT